MSVHLAPIGNGFQFLDANGRPLTAGKLYTYQAGTTTPAATYTTAAGNVANTNPIVLGADGRPPQEIWLTDQQAYKFVLQDVLSNMIGTYDNLTGIGDLTVALAAVSTLQTQLAATAAPTGASMVGFSIPATTAVGETVQAKLVQVVSVKDFGAVGDGTTDDTAAIQAAINWAIYQNAGAQHSLGKVVIPGGIYKISDTIQIGYGTSYTSLVLEGDGMRELAQTGLGGTALVPTFNDRPCVNFQGARNSVLRGLSMLGKNYNYINTNQLGSNAGPLGGINDLLDASWVDPALPGSASTRYAPYAGVSIDAYSGAQPATHYPNVTFPAFLGAVSQYGKNFSSNVLLENVSISGFVVGVVNQPCNADGNGDFTKLRRVQISQCQYAVSIGNTQSRDFHIQDSTIVQAHTAVVTDKNGVANGCTEILVESTEISNCMYWHHIQNTAFQLGPCFSYCHGEGGYAIGVLSRGAQSNSSTTYRHCYFGFDGRTARGEPVYTLENSSGMVTFDSCTFENPNGTGPVNLQGGAGLYRIVACNQLFGGNATLTFQKLATNACAGFTFGNVTAGIADFSLHATYVWDLDAGTSTSGFLGLLNAGARSTLVPIYTRFARSNSVGDSGVSVSLESRSSEDKSVIVGAITTAGRNVTFTSARPEEQLINSGGVNGDIVYDDATGVIFYIRSRAGSVITMQAQTGYDAAGNLLTAVTKTGNFWYQNARAYSPGGYTQGDISTASTVVTNVGADNSATFGGISVNDFAAVWPVMDNWINTGAAANKITAVNGAGGTFTLTANPNKTQTKRRFAIFYRAEPANA